MAFCTKHATLAADDDCGHCGHAYCVECLVRPFGPARPPLCIRCALSFGGVSTMRVARRRPSRRQRAGRRPATAPVPRTPEPSFTPIVETPVATSGPADLPEWANR